MPNRSRLQRLRACVCLPITLSMAPSLDRDLSCLRSLPSNSKLPALLSQHQSSLVTMCSPEWAEVLCLYHSSLRDRDRVITSGPASSCSPDGPCSSSSHTKQTDTLVYFFFCVGVTVTDTDQFAGSVAMPGTGVLAATVLVSRAGIAAMLLV